MEVLKKDLKSPLDGGARSKKGTIGITVVLPKNHTERKHQTIHHPEQEGK